ncbi:MAG: MBL fold metallo-hydrolase [Candidatus Thorarchaeota archaeon]
MTFRKYLSQVSDGVFLFAAPRTRFANWRRSGNIILLQGEQGISLIDSGGNAAKQHLIPLVNRFLDDSNGEVHCLHTHGHIDHMAGDPILTDRFQAKIWASEEAVPFVRAQTPLLLDMERPFMVVTFRELFLAPEWFVEGVMRLTMGRNHPTDTVHVVRDDTDPAGTGFQPLPLPGHHPGHIGFFHRERGILVAGDLLDPRHRMKPVLTAPSSDFELMGNTLEVVLSLSPQILILGHGNPFVGEEAVRNAIERSLETLRNAQHKVIESLESEPLTLGGLSTRLQRQGLGPGDVFRRMFIHSILRHLLSRDRVLRTPTQKGMVEFSLR